MAKSKSKVVAKRVRRFGDYASLLDAPDQHRIQIADPLFQLLWEPALDLKGKLDVLEATLVPNVRAMLRELCDHAPDPALAKSDAALCIAVMTRQLGAAFDDLIRPKREAPTPVKPVRARHASNKSSRARG